MKMETKKYSHDLSKGRVYNKKCEFCKKSFNSKQCNRRFCSKHCQYMNTRIKKPKQSILFGDRKKFRKLCVKCGMFFLPDGKERTCVVCKKPNVIKI